MFMSYDGLSLEEITLLHEIQLISGVTTNLTLVNAAKKSLNKSRIDIIQPLLSYCEKNALNFSVQVESEDPSDIEKEAKELATIAKDLNRFYVKIPVNFENLIVIRNLTNFGIKVNATCVTSHMQGRLAAVSGAKIVSFFWGKMSDQGINPFEHVQNYSNWAGSYFKSESPILLVGSVRQLGSIESAYLAGADVVTTSYVNIRNLANQLTSDKSASLFYETNQ
jgi:transaldolase